MFSKYRELRLSLIPLWPGQKIPFEKGWTKFCERLPTIQEAASWDKGNFGFGLALGSASNISALDIDSDDIIVLKACKQSPVVKRGKKGETRFFKFCPELSSTKIAGCIDILASGRQTVLPPSTHPDTGQPYFWLTFETLENYKASDLPTLTNEDIIATRRILEPQSLLTYDIGSNNKDSPWQNLTSGQVIAGARNSTLTSIVGGLLRCGLHPKEVYEYVLYLNANKFFPPLEIPEIETVIVSIMKREYKRRTRNLT